MVLSQSSRTFDPLSDVLTVLDARATRRTRFEGSGDWALAFPALERLKFVAVLRGAAWLLLPDAVPQRIAAGELHPAYGLTVVHSFEQFLYEGVAQTLTDLVFSDDELDDDRLWARDYARYRSYIYHRAHLDLNMGVDIRAVFRYLDSSLPFEDWAGMETELRSRCLDPILRAYQFVYAASDYAFLSALRTHGKKAFLSFIRDLYAGPRTMGDVLRALQQGALPPQTARW